MQKCEGEAHSNAHIDGCSICSPQWGHFYACPSCLMKLRRRSPSSLFGTCPNDECLSFGESFETP